MPTKVRRHYSHTRGGKRTVVRSYVRTGPEHSARWRELVAEIREKGYASSPEAVATKILGDRSFTSKERRKLARKHKELI